MNVNWKEGTKRRLASDYSIEISNHILNILVLSAAQEKKISFLEGQLQKQDEMLKMKEREESNTMEVIMETQRNYKEALEKGIPTEEKGFTVVIEGGETEPEEGWREVIRRKGKQMKLPKPRDIVITS